MDISSDLYDKIDTLLHLCGHEVWHRAWCEDGDDADHLLMDTNRRAEQAWTGLDKNYAGSVFDGLLLMLSGPCNIDELHRSDRRQLINQTNALIWAIGPMDDKTVLAAAVSFPDIVPTMLAAGGNPLAITDEITPRGLLDLLLDQATALQDNHGIEGVVEIFHEILERGVYPNPSLAHRVWPPLCEVLMAADENPWLYDILTAGLRRDPSEATTILWVLASVSHSCADMIDIAVAAGGRLDDTKLRNNENFSVIDQARCHVRPEVVACFEKHEAQRVARQLDGQTIGATHKTTRRI